MPALATPATTGVADVLVVEDSPTNVAVIRRLLSTYVDETGTHAVVRVAGDLATAEAELLAAPPDVVLLDLTLPDSSGLATFDRVRALADLPIVVLTGTEDHDLALEAVSRGAQDFVVKTQLTAAVLGRIVEHAIARHGLAVRLREAMGDVEVANARIRALVSMASHELLSPMATVQGFASLLDERWDELPEEDRRQYVATIARRSGHLARLARQFLDIAANDGGDIPARPTRFDLVELTREVVDAGGHTADVRLDSPIRCLALADRDHVGSVLGNLLTNAAKYGRPPVEIRITEASDDVVVLVRDHGTGIPEADVGTLFDAYTRGDASAQDRAGHGLGMHIVQRLVAANDGTVTYRGTDQGAAFEVRLPRP